MDVKAIIFLAPISVFDERLEADLGVNRLEDSMKFWTSICQSKLLVKVPLSACLACFRADGTDEPMSCHALDM